MPRAVIHTFYQRLYETFGPQHWWPGETPFEVIIGAILTQNTNWRNVERALTNLKNHKALTPRALRRMPAGDLAALIRPAGYFNVKARRVKNFIDYLYNNYNGDLEGMAAVPTRELRAEILTVNGIGPETADSILLYAFDRPVFVIDAYTKRLLYRHGLIDRDTDYAAMQALFVRHLDEDRQLFNEYHALIVRIGKDFCKPVPRCEQCPLNGISYSLRDRCERCFRVLQNAGQRGKRSQGGSVCGGCQVPGASSR